MDDLFMLIAAMMFSSIEYDLTIKVEYDNESIQQDNME